jgi:hypothetical protein
MYNTKLLQPNVAHIPTETSNGKRFTTLRQVMEKETLSITGIRLGSRKLSRLIAPRAPARSIPRTLERWT